jgi:hypothetical protein
MQQMRQQYDAELKKVRDSYERRLQSLEQRLKKTEDAAAAAAIKATDAQRAAEAAQQAPTPEATARTEPPASGGGATASAGAFNPAIGAVLDGTFGYFSKNPDKYRIPGFALGPDAGPGTRGFNVNESEVNLSASVDPYLYGNLTLAFSKDSVSVEEGFLQTTSLPYGFTVRAGRFFSGVGYMNEQHAHVWDFVDTALPYRALLNTQYDDDGVQLRWLAPTETFLEFGAEAFRGDSFPASGPGSRWAGAYSGFAHVGADLSESSTFRTGLSYLHTKAINRTTNDGADVFRGADDTWIADFVYKWAPEGNPVETNFKLQAEYFLQNETGAFNGLGVDSPWRRGWYAQGVYQFARGWQTGLRYDRLSANSPGPELAGSTLDPLGATPQRFSVDLTYFTSEFGRFRLQYNLDEARPKTDHQALLQYTISIGAHGAHQF